jgi:colicin import membrane protein
VAAAALAHDTLLPRGDSRLGLGAVLALLAHALLIGALAIGLNWRLPTQTAVLSAELWSAVPQSAAPAPAPPPPAPPPVPAPERRAEPPAPSAAEQAAVRDAEIAVEKAARRLKDEQARESEQREQARQRREADEARRLKQKLEAQRQADDQAAQQRRDQKAREDKRLKDLADQRLKAEQAAQAAEAKAQDALVAKQREENLKRMLGQAGAAASGTGAANAGGNAARDAAPSAGYAGRLKAHIKPNIVLPAEVSGNPIAEVEVKCAPDGSVVGRRISKSSGNPVWDETVLRAIDRTRILPRDTDGRIPATMILVFPRQE